MSIQKICSICKEKPATTFTSYISADNKKTDLDLCDACAKAKGIDDPAALLVASADLMLGLGASQEIEQAAGGVDLKCPRCGFTQTDFKKSGRFGCPECYLTFAEGLGGHLKAMHKGTRHIGKTPEALRVSRENSDRLKTLQKKLAKAVESENFEEAANVRDEIKQMTEGSTPLKNLTR
ncbi:MAG TPA: UvrB/UvrC motif-containing protein [Verrucomicrobiae bacterium]|nr:UvrB/UvrC motif-containing protein [Verrucomicrobiae bacterium]